MRLSTSIPAGFQNRLFNIRSQMYLFDHIPTNEKEYEWFLLLKPILQARFQRDIPEKSRLVQALNAMQGIRTWQTVKQSIETTLKAVENGNSIFSRKSEVENDENPDNPIEDMFAEFRAIGYLQ